MNPTATTPALRAITEIELDAAYATYLAVFDWLNAKGIRQWLRALPAEAFAQRQRAGELLGCVVNGQIAAVVTLASERSPYWPEILGDENRWWIKTLAVSRACSGRGLGADVVRACEQVIRDAGATEAFLDCVDVGFLPGYYARLGYTPLGQKEITYPSGNAFLVTLMKKNLAATATPATGPAEFRRLALAQPGASEGAHMGHADFRVKGKIFATLGYPDDAHGMVKLTPHQQRALMQQSPAAFSPCAGAWGLRGATAVRLEAVAVGPLRAAIERAARNVATPAKRRSP